MSAIGILRSFAEARCADHEPIPARLTYGTIREVLRIIEEWERSARKPTNETTPDAVERYEPDQKYIGSGEYVVEMFPDPNGEWVRHTTLLAERARHAEEVASHRAHAGDLDDVIVAISRQRDHLRDQLRRVEGERDRMQRANETLAVRMDLPASQLLMVGSELCGDGKIDPNDHRDPRWTPTLQQAAKVMRELTSLRSLLPDVRACAEYCRNMIGPPPGIPVEDYPLPPVALAARRILAALDSQGGEGE